MISIIYSILFLLHPIHISVSEINYSEKDKALQITSRIFIDDLELSVRAQRKEPELDLIEPQNGLTTEKMVSDYVLKHFSVKLDGKLQKMNFLGMEREDPALICYIEIENVKKFKTIEVRNDIIMEIHDDQSSIVHVTYKGPIKSMRLTRENGVGTITFADK
ncbi:MAG: hypothetical protein OEU76_05845 [Cyclobacteriaceae bacterium]|jgi:hypothetical protein|nr:hypothetical protein [Cyclobacteriaceae bacterium]